MIEVIIGLAIIIGGLTSIAIISYLLGCLIFRNNPFKRESFNDGTNYLIGLVLMVVIALVILISYHIGNAIIN